MDNRPSALQLAIVGAIFLLVGGFGLWATQAPANELAHRIAVAPAVFCGLLLVGGCFLCAAVVRWAQGRGSGSEKKDGEK